MYNAIYTELEKHLRPLILKNASRIVRALGWQFDDAYQEAALALFEGMKTYDYNVSKGRLKSYANIILRNRAITLIHQQQIQRRVPHTRESRGQVTKHFRMSSFEDKGADVLGHDQQPEVEYAQASAPQITFLKRLLPRLTAREYAVFRCIYVPTDEYLSFLRKFKKGPSKNSTGAFLGLRKNAVDYCSHAIRLKMTSLAEEIMPESVRLSIKNGTWPMIHVSRMPQADDGFVKRTIASRGLDPNPIGKVSTQHDYQKRWARRIQPYKWGVVMYLKNGDVFRTLVIEGQVNVDSGIVLGTSGTIKQIADLIRWYPQLSKELGGK